MNTTSNSIRRVAAGVIRRAAHEEALAAEKSPQAIADQKLIERRCSADLRGAALIATAAPLEGIAHRVIREKSEDVRREVQHHQVAGVLLAHQPAGQQREAGLHEEHQIAGVQRPRSIRGDSHVADRVGQLRRQRLFRRLRLILVEIGFFLGDNPDRPCRSARRRQTNCRRHRQPHDLSPVAKPDGSGCGSAAGGVAAVSVAVSAGLSGAGVVGESVPCEYNRLHAINATTMAAHIKAVRKSNLVRLSNILSSFAKNGNRNRRHFGRRNGATFDRRTVPAWRFRAKAQAKHSATNAQCAKSPPTGEMNKLRGGVVLQAPCQHAGKLPRDRISRLN